MSSAELCLQCQSLFTGIFPELNSPGKKHHASIRDMQLAAENGCFICTGIISILNVQVITVAPEDYYIEMCVEGENEWSLRVRWTKSDDVQTWASPFFYIPSQDEHDLSSIVTPPNRSPSSKSLALEPGSIEAGEVSGSANTSFLQQCMNTCLQTHTVCQQLPTGYWPTRVADVGTVTACECCLCITETGRDARTIRNSQPLLGRCSDDQAAPEQSRRHDSIH